MTLCCKLLKTQAKFRGWVAGIRTGPPHFSQPDWNWLPLLEIGPEWLPPCDRLSGGFLGTAPLEGPTPPEQSVQNRTPFLLKFSLPLPSVKARGRCESAGGCPETG